MVTRRGDGVDKKADDICEMPPPYFHVLLSMEEGRFGSPLDVLRLWTSTGLFAVVILEAEWRPFRGSW